MTLRLATSSSVDFTWIPKWAGNRGTGGASVWFRVRLMGGS